MVTISIAGTGIILIASFLMISTISSGGRIGILIIGEGGGVGVAVGAGVGVAEVVAIGEADGVGVGVVDGVGVGVGVGGIIMYSCMIKIWSPVRTVILPTVSVITKSKVMMVSRGSMPS